MAYDDYTRTPGTDNRADIGDTTTLNTLIGTLIDSIEGYQKAAADTTNTRFAEMFNPRARAPAGADQAAGGGGPARRQPRGRRHHRRRRPSRLDQPQGSSARQRRRGDRQGSRARRGLPEGEVRSRDAPHRPARRGARRGRRGVDFGQGR